MKCTGANVPRFLCEYRGEVPGCPGGVGAYEMWPVVADVSWSMCVSVGHSREPASHTKWLN